MENIFEVIRSKKKCGPKIIMISPTDYCNLKCKTCWRLRKDATFNQPSYEFLEKIIREAKELGTEIIDLTGGGEGFMRKDILKIMKLVKILGMKGLITTNCTLVKKDYVKEIVEMGWDEINFSLDGSSPEINDYIRGHGVYEKCIKTIKEFNKIKKEMKTKKPLLRLTFTITRKNFTDIPNFILLAKKLNIKNINFSRLFKWETNKEFWIGERDKKVVDSILRKSLKLSEGLDIKTNLSSIIEFGLDEHEPPKFCFAPWYMLFINASKEAMACCTLATLYHNLLGKVENLEKIWFGKKMEKMRERMKKREFFPECKNCLPEFTQMFNKMYEEMMKWNLKK